MACRSSAVLRSAYRLVSVARPSALRPTRPSAARWSSSASSWAALPAAPATCSVNSRLRPQWWGKREGGVVLTCRSYAGDSAMSLGDLKDRVLDVLKMFDKINPDKVSMESHFVNDLGLDSLDVVEIVMAFEDEFAVEIDDEQAEKIFTPADAVEFLKTKLDIH